MTFELPGEALPEMQLVFRAALTSINRERFFHLRVVRMPRAGILSLREGHTHPKNSIETKKSALQEA